MTLKLLNNEVEYINENYPNIRNYNKLHIDSCIYLKSITLLPNITKLYISNCPNLQLILNNSIYIEKIAIINCFNLRSLPNKLTNLTYLYLYDSNIKKISKSYFNLKTLIIKYNKNKKFQIKEIPSYNNLLTLILENCNKLKKLPDKLPKINKIYIISCFYIEDVPDNYTTIKEYYMYYTVNNIFIKSIYFKINMDDFYDFDDYSNYE